MANADLTNSIDDLAAEWAVEVVYGELTPESRAELDSWLAADRRHRGAFLRARAWLCASEDAVTQAARPAVSLETVAAPPPLDNRETYGREDTSVFFRKSWSTSARSAVGRVAVAASAAVIVAGFVTVALISSVPAPAPVKRPAPVALERVVKLKDGSVATLSSNARIEIALSPTLRSITLLSGEATFHVAKDWTRPFVVRSGAVYAEATGTIYSVRRVGLRGGAVSVAEGRVLVWPRDERDQAVLLQAGGTMTLDPSPATLTASATPPLPPPDVARISLDNVSIESAAKRFNRINSTKIVIADARIGNIKIIGFYRADQPEKFAQAAAAISGGKVTHEKGEIVIESR